MGPWGGGGGEVQETCEADCNARYEITQLRVMGAVDPGLDGHRMLRVEHIRRRRIVHDDCLRNIAAQPPEIL